MAAACRAALFDGPGRPFRFVAFPRPEARSREIVARVTFCTICGSDLHTLAGRRAGPTPSVLGHEIVGRIVQFGSGASRLDLRGADLREGDRITWTSAASCGTCYFCTRELPQKCERVFKYGHESINGDNPWGGGLADFCVLVPGTGIVRVPDDLPDAVVCPANCATATVMVALRTAGGCRDRHVLIQGAGMLGLTACAVASVQGAASIVCTDLNDERLRVASRFGATHVVLASPQPLHDAVAAITKGRGFDLAFEFSGTANAMADGLRLLRIGGRSVWVGAVYPVPAIPIEPEWIVKRWLTIQGVHNYAPSDLLAAIDFLAANHQRFPFSDLVSASYPLQEIEEAFHQAQTSGAVRVAVRPEG